MSTLDVLALIRNDVSKFNSVYEPWADSIKVDLQQQENIHKQQMKQRKDDLTSSTAQIKDLMQIKTQQEKGTSKISTIKSCFAIRANQQFNFMTDTTDDDHH
jgi:hypothetical protein